MKISNYYIIFLTSNILNILPSSFVDAYWEMTPVVFCNDNNICVGEYTTYTPSPVMRETEEDTLIYAGGWGWQYKFVDGVEGGTDTSYYNSNEMDQYFTGLQVDVEMEDDRKTCQVKVGGDVCNRCSNCNDPSSTDGVFDVFVLSADCTNVENGRIVECEPLSAAANFDQPYIFYPLQQDQLQQHDNNSNNYVVTMWLTYVWLEGYFIDPPLDDVEDMLNRTEKYILDWIHDEDADAVGIQNLTLHLEGSFPGVADPSHSKTYQIKANVTWKDDPVPSINSEDIIDIVIDNEAIEDYIVRVLWEKDASAFYWVTGMRIGTNDELGQRNKNNI
jgi:hypothetical protein